MHVLYHSRVVAIIHALKRATKSDNECEGFLRCEGDYPSYYKEKLSMANSGLYWLPEEYNTIVDKVVQIKGDKTSCDQFLPNKRGRSYDTYCKYQS